MFAISATANTTEHGKMDIAASSTYIFVSQDDDTGNGTAFDAKVFLITSASGAVTASQIATLENGATASSQIVFGDFV